MPVPSVDLEKINRLRRQIQRGKTEICRLTTTPGERTECMAAFCEMEAYLADQTTGRNPPADTVTVME